MEIKIVIPTYKRAGMVLTHKIAPHAILSVTRSEVPAYRALYPNVEIDEHPDDVAGMAMKRQFIYDRFGDVLMLDDDLSQVSRLYVASNKVRIQKMTPDEVYDLVQWAGNTARLCGCYLFGFNKNPSPIIYRPWQPIKLSGFVTGAAMGMLRGSRISFNPLVSGSIEDFYASGINAYYHRRAFIDTRFCFVQEETFKRTGGMGATRTMDDEKEGTLFLRRQFGNVISMKEGMYGGGAKGAKTVNQNPYGRTMTIPF